MFAFKSRDADLGAKGRLRIRDRDHAVQIVPFALKERMLLHMQNNIEVARGTAMKTAFAESREADASAIFDSGRNFRVNRSLAQNPAFAFALGTWIGDYTACTLASGTSAGNTEEALLVRTCPRPLQERQVTGALPGAAPEPRHSSQLSWRRTVTLVSVPKTASSNSRLISSRRSAPRWVRLRFRVPPPKISPRPKKSPKISPRSLASKPCAPPPPPRPAWP